MADSEPFIGEIALFAGFVPKGWLPCDGRVVPISSFTALHAVIGDQFGTASPSSFTLPDLRGMVPVGTGAGPGLSPVAAGQTFGTTSAALGTAQAGHSHALQRKSASSFAHKSNAIGPNANLGQLARQYDVLNNKWELVPHFISNTEPDTTMAPGSIGMAGAGQPHENRQPFVAWLFGIAAWGEFPFRP